MAKYELSNDQIRNLRSVLAAVQIRGAEAPMILDLQRALAVPVKESPKKEKSGEKE